MNKLITTRPSGNNHAWLQHTRDAAPQAPTAAEAVLHLLVWRYWGPSGRCSSRTVGSVKAANVTAGPLRSALSYHPEGRSLFETLLAGVAEPDPDVQPERDLCPWEWEALPEPVQAPDVVRGPCSGLPTDAACSHWLSRNHTSPHIEKRDHSSLATRRTDRRHAAAHRRPLQ